MGVSLYIFKRAFPWSHELLPGYMKDKMTEALSTGPSGLIVSASLVKEGRVWSQLG